MANQINQYPVQATEIENEDFVDIDKNISVGVYESQKILGSDLNYDSGDKLIPWHNGTYGLADTGNDQYRPSIRIINRVATINGTLVLPMQQTPGVLDGVGSGYPSSAFEDLFQSTLNGGWTVTSQAHGVTHDPILPANLTPASNSVLAFNIFALRNIFDDDGKRTRLTAYMSTVVLLSTGELFFSPIEANERDGATSSASKNPAHLMRKLTSKFDRSDRVSLYTNYRNSFDSLGNDLAINDSAVLNTFDFDHDGTLAGGFGGYIISMNFSYNIDSSLTIAQIRSAFDSM